MKSELAKTILLKKYKELGGKLFGEYLLRQKGDDEVKKSIEANDFMMHMLTGKPIKQDWKMEETEEYKQMGELAKIINTL